VFDPFFTTKGARGTGLGLSIVYGIVRRMQGHLSVESDPGDGTRVEMRFPLATAPVEPVVIPAPPTPEPATVTRQLQVLVVDDEPDVCALVADICQSLGHLTMVCGSGAEALEAYDTGGFDIVLSDLGMPGMTGWDLVRAVRERDAVIPIALVTGWGDTVDEQFARKSGVDLVIAKPFTIDDIARALALAQQRDRNAA
jgi:CheY-like chemotaxis protein